VFVRNVKRLINKNYPTTTVVFLLRGSELLSTLLLERCCKRKNRVEQSRLMYVNGSVLLFYSRNSCTFSMTLEGGRGRWEVIEEGILSLIELISDILFVYTPEGPVMTRRRGTGPWSYISMREK
jgi:hypothetical protein